MKRMFTIFLMVVMPCSQAASLDEEYSGEQVMKKLDGYGRMRTGGAALIAGGIVLDGITTAVLVSGIKKTNSSSDLETGLGGMGLTLLGSLGLIIGIVMTSAGIVVTTIGVKKTRQYEEILKRVSLTVTPNSVAVGYDF